MDIGSILKTTRKVFLSWSKSKLYDAIEALRAECCKLKEQKDALQLENDKLREDLKKAKIKEVNKKVNEPSSKQPEWEIKGVGNDGKEKKKGKGRGKSPRKGAGNRAKTKEPDRTVTATVDDCSLCGKDLRNVKPLKTTADRIIEDIPAVVEKPEIILVKQEMKYCPDCQKVIKAKSELALPGADNGLNCTILMCYLWVASCLPFPKIQEYLRTFFGKKISTSGISKQAIKVSQILNEVYAEILRDVKNGVTLFADETGWRVRGKNWWLWVFGTENSAYFTIDKSRGSDVVRRIMGEIFFGVLVVDGWHAYLSLLCEQQSCMAHLLRKIRKFREAFPHLVDIARFYLRLRRIIRAGEKLQESRKELGELVFLRRLKRLKERLSDLLEWQNPDEILGEIIKKVRRQQPRILTFVEHPGVPCHNNYGEFLIRLGVLKRKISGGSVSPEGAEAYAVLLSVYVTCKLRGISFPKYMEATLKHYIKTGTTMSLAAYAENMIPDLVKAA